METSPGLVDTCAVALFGDEVDMKAAEVARKGSRAVDGLTIKVYQYRGSSRRLSGPVHIPRSANAALDLAVESIF